MLRLRDIMTRDVLTVSPELTIRDAMELFVARHVSGAPVVSGGAVVGVVSATDLLAFAAGLGAGSSDDAPDLEPDLPAPEPPLEDEPPAAYFTELWSDDGSAVTQRLGTSGATPASPLDEHTVADAMTRLPVCAMTPGTMVDTAADQMRRAQIHRVLVMTGPHLDGIVTTTDIANAVADHRMVNRTYVFDGARGTFRGGRT